MSKKKKQEEVEEEEVAPFWMISFSDMMSLLLSFFILLFSMSTIEKEKMTAVMESMGDRYLSSGHRSKRNASPPKLDINLPKGKDTAQLPPPELKVLPKPDIAKPVNGVIIPFASGSDQLDAAGKKTLDTLAAQLKGMPYTILVKGHASKKEVDTTPAYQRVDDLAYARVFNVRDYLISQGLKPGLFQLVELGQFKPLQAHQLSLVTGNVVDQNAYVEVIQVMEEEE